MIRRRPSCLRVRHLCIDWTASALPLCRCCCCCCLVCLLLSDCHLVVCLLLDKCLNFRFYHFLSGQLTSQPTIPTTEMADDIVQDDDELTPGYKPPAEKTLSEIVKADEDDESLKKYKESLLGCAISNVVIVDENVPSRVIVKSLALVVDGRPDLIIDLSKDLDKVKKQVVTIKDGIQYRLRINFFVQREIVTGLKFVQKISRHGVKVVKTSNMVGSYAPKTELQAYTTPVEEMPSGMLARGTYTVKSLFTDDDNNEHLKWEWTFELKKDWQ